MAGADPIILALAQLGALGVPAVLLAWILRASGAPGGVRAAAICAGVFVGLMAGPGALGAKWPSRHEALFVGGVEERRALDTVLSRQREEIVAMETAGVTPVAIEELARSHDAELDPLLDALASARATHRTRLDGLGLGLLALVALGIAPSLVPKSRGAARGLVRAAASAGVGPIASGILALLLACAAPAAAYSLAAPADARASLAAGLLLGVAGLSLALPRRLSLASAWAFGAGGLAIVSIAWSPWLAVSLAALALGTAAALVCPARTVRRVRRVGRALAWHVALPVVTAFLAVRFDPGALASNNTRDFWASLIIAFLWSSDGRWLAFWMALRTTGAERAVWTLSSRWVNAGTDAVMVGAGLAMVATGVASDALVFGALVGAAMVSLSGGARLAVARILETPAPESKTGR